MRGTQIEGRRRNHEGGETEGRGSTGEEEKMKTRDRRCDDERRCWRKRRNTSKALLV